MRCFLTPSMATEIVQHELAFSPFWHHFERYCMLSVRAPLHGSADMKKFQSSQLLGNFFVLRWQLRPSFQNFLNSFLLGVQICRTESKVIDSPGFELAVWGWSTWPVNITQRAHVFRHSVHVILVHCYIFREVTKIINYKVFLKKIWKIQILKKYF